MHTRGSPSIGSFLAIVNHFRDTRAGVGKHYLVLPGSNFDRMKRWLFTIRLPYEVLVLLMVVATSTSTTSSYY